MGFADHSLTQVVESAVKQELKRPRRFKVLLLNDDYTPMDFVVEVLQCFFAMPEERAQLVMWQVHTEGKGLCGIYTRDIAETKITLVNDYAKAHENPLLCVMEPE